VLSAEADPQIAGDRGYVSLCDLSEQERDCPLACINRHGQSELLFVIFARYGDAVSGQHPPDRLGCHRRTTGEAEHPIELVRPHARESDAAKLG
jgi:hypothetical protein